MALKKSTVAIGTAFEKLSIQYLQSKYNGMKLQRRGQAGDGGVDFQGTWTIGAHAQIEVLGQCKRFKRAVPPKDLREFSAACNHRRNQSTELDCLGIFASSSGYTKACLEEVYLSDTPLYCIHLNAATGQLMNGWLNRAARKGFPCLVMRSTIAKHGHLNEMWTTAPPLEQQ
eukprot:TRINITY_DN6418_c0_g1_i1.p2 TRINITY_DN6418_c0_g1~~TRINITY_DN6418_c0_g1_i1.p2  ORF type:complete len:172 (+),score=11.23 TRINITY_DN6418_c0_g1_i1:889-1404(+)